MGHNEWLTRLLHGACRSNGCFPASRPQAIQGTAHTFGGFIQFGALPHPPVRLDPEAVALRAGEHVKVHVEHLLEGSLAVGQ
jgi:hypothetical protein